MLFEFKLRDTALNLMFNIIDENWINTLSYEMKIDRYAKDYSTESQLRSLVFFHLSKLDSLRDLHGLNFCVFHQNMRIQYLPKQAVPNLTSINPKKSKYQQKNSLHI